ncbi:MAG: hypothetical protein ABIC04_00250 [Nanoarchaeota archaeon]
MYRNIKAKLFSEREINDLLKAWIAISFAFAVVFNGFSFRFEFIYYFLISSLTVGVGFLLHELAHRTVARHYGCFAEFKSFDSMLILAVAMSFFGFVFAAPGAVMIHGPVGKTRNGIISAAGPGVNLVLALLFLIISIILKPTGILLQITSYGFLVNSWLALFNLIPFGNFDGRKIMVWNKLVFFVMISISLVFMLFQGKI